MSNAINTTATATATALVWATKSGAARAAHSEVGAALAPRAVRLEGAQAAMLKSMSNQYYVGFIADVAASFSGPKRAGLVDHIRSSLSIDKDGQTLAPVGDVLAGRNKATATAVAIWLQSPYALKGSEKKGFYREALELTKNQALYRDVAGEWLATLET